MMDESLLAQQDPFVAARLQKEQEMSVARAAAEHAAAMEAEAAAAAAANQNYGVSQSRDASESPPTSPPSSEAPPPSDDEFTSFVLRRAAQRLGVDYVPGSNRASPTRSSQQPHHHHHHHNHHSVSSHLGGVSGSSPASAAAAGGAGGGTRGRSVSSFGGTTSVAGAATSVVEAATGEPGVEGEQQQQQRQPEKGVTNTSLTTLSVHRSSSVPRSQSVDKEHNRHLLAHEPKGAAHPIDTMRSHHWQDQLSSEDLNQAHVSATPHKFPSTLKTARNIATMEKRLQEPPPPGLGRFAQFMDCTTEEIGRMIDIRERSLGETHSSVPPLYDVLGDMMAYQGETAQAERFYTIALNRLEARVAIMQQQQQQQESNNQNSNRSGSTLSTATALLKNHYGQHHPVGSVAWMKEAASWAHEVSCLQGKLAMLWLQQGKKDAAQAAFVRAAQLANPAMADTIQISDSLTAATGGSVSLTASSGVPAVILKASGVSPNSSHNKRNAAGGSGRSDSPATLHLRQLLSGVHRDKNLIASNLGEKVLNSVTAANNSPSVSVTPSSTATTLRHNNNKTPNQLLDGDLDEDILPSDSRSVSAPVKGGGAGGGGNTNRREASNTPMRSNSYGAGGGNLSLSRQEIRDELASTPPSLHDANSLKKLVDEVSHSEKNEGSRSRMRQQISSLQTGSLSPARRHHNLHGGGGGGAGSNNSGPGSVSETIRKTKDLQDVISRIRHRADLMPQAETKF